MSNQSTPTSAIAEDKAKRVRDLLSSYYGNQAPPGSGSATPEAVTPSRGKGGLSGRGGSGLDSAAFDADRYLSQLLRSTRLDGLLSKHVEMSTEIKFLDSDMQMLVYENYNKFISATDTIRSMKSNVDGMDSNMSELKSVIGTALPYVTYDMFSLTANIHVVYTECSCLMLFVQTASHLVVMP